VRQAWAGIQQLVRASASICDGLFFLPVGHYLPSRTALGTDFHALRAEAPPTQFEIALRTFTFGLSAYAITFMIYGVLGVDFIIPEIKRDAGFLERKFLNQFATAIAVSLVCAVVWLYLPTTRYWVQPSGRSVLRKALAKKMYGILSSIHRKLRWQYVYVRDYDKQKVFSGWVRAFSESPDARELLLRNVQVFDLEGRFLYEVPLMYIGRKRDSIDIEFPVTEAKERAT
jgi:hypothetical protein